MQKKRDLEEAVFGLVADDTLPAVVKTAALTTLSWVMGHREGDLLEALDADTAKPEEMAG